MSNINININRPNYLIEKYPEPVKGCPNNKVLYRVTFKYKSNLSSDKLYDVTSKNFLFRTTGHDQKIKAGALVIYKPKAKSSQKQHPNKNQIAIITKSSGFVEGRDAQKVGLPIDSKNSRLFDIKFINPLVVNNKVINTKKEVPLKDLEILPVLEAYICAPSFIPAQLIENYLQARNSLRVSKNGSVPEPFKNIYANKQQWLAAQENALWNQYFELDKNNQPTNPKWSGVGSQNFENEKRVRDILNEYVENIVKTGFTPNKLNTKTTISGKKNNWILSFNMPEGATPGQTLTIPVDGLNIVVTIPIELPDGSIPVVNKRISVPITRNQNNSIYDTIKKSKKKSFNLDFVPTFIDAQYSDDKQLDLEKMVKPSKNQAFKIVEARIIKQKDSFHTTKDNFKFKKLVTFNKNISKLVFDIEVEVDLVLDIKEKLSKEEQKKRYEEESKSLPKAIVNNIGRKAKSLLLNGGNDCPYRMKKLKQHGSNMLLGVLPKRDLETQGVKKVVDAMNVSQQNMVANERNRQENIRSGRPGVRRGGKRTRKNKHKRKLGKTKKKFKHKRYTKQKKIGGKKKTKKRR